MKKSKFCKLISVFMIIALLQCSVATGAVLADESDGVDTTYAEKVDLTEKRSFYSGWLEYSCDQVTAVENSSGAIGAPDQKNNGVLINDENSFATWEIDIPESKDYNLKISYYSLGDRGIDPQISLLIDGASPYKEVSPFSLRLNWQLSIPDNTFERDEKGNDLQPGQIKVNNWISEIIGDRSGLYTDPYIFNLSAGKHKVTLKRFEGDLAISGIAFGSETVTSYNEYIKSHSNSDKKVEKVVQEAEFYYITNNSAISPVADRLEDSTSPNDPVSIRLNSIGANGWSSQGDMISWKANVKTAGLYKISFRARQGSKVSMKAYRKLLINGKLPFAEAENLAFPYDTKWYMQSLGDENKPYLFYLKPNDVISLICTTGEMAPILREVNDAMTLLNQLYLEIISYTSASPDAYQDYQLEVKIPGISKRLTEISNILKESSKQIQNKTGSAGSQASTIDYSISIIDTFAENPYLITEQLSSLKTSLETLSSLLQTINSCPLELDYMIFSAENEKIENRKMGFFASLQFKIKQFINAFTNDYNTANVSDKNKINVWVSTGRDQAQIMKNLIRNTFTPQTKIDVSLNLVDTGQTLIRASLAGKGPDVALMLPATTAVDLSARGALVELSQYGLDDIKNDYHQSAFTPFYYKNGLYALPETETFNMLFYRTDIFKKNGLSVPKTWDEFYKTMEALNRQNMLVGIQETSAATLGVSASLFLFEALLVQNGGGYYNSDFTKTRFDENAASTAFSDWVKLYKDYGADRQYDFYSRFRTGEMPMAIEPLSAYASLQQAAPELQGLWTIAPLPGTVTEDGSVNNTEPSTCTGCIMLKGAQKRGVADKAYKFMRWWISSDTQSEYGKGLEQNLGVFGRFYTANKVAFETLAWTSSEQKIIKSQWDNIYNQPQIPGNYVVQRSLTSALRAVLDSNYSNTRALRIYNYDMNEELTRKQKEFS